MGKVYEVSRGDWSRIFRTNDIEDLKSALTKEINKKTDHNTQLGFFIFVREFGDKEENNQIYCLADEVLVP